MNYTPVSYVPFRGQSNIASIHVPQAHYGIARGTVKDIGLMETRVAQCLAISLAEPVTHDRAPKVVLGHIDDNGDVAVMTHTLLKNFGSHPRDLRAYLVTGDYEPNLFDTVAATLTKAGVAFQADRHESQVVRFAVNLETGLAVTSSCLSNLPHYNLDKRLESDCTDFVFRRPNHQPIRRIFDLSSNMPKNYFKANPAPVAKAPEPQ